MNNQTKATKYSQVICSFSSTPLTFDVQFQVDPIPIWRANIWHFSLYKLHPKSDKIDLDDCLPLAVSGPSIESDGRYQLIRLFPTTKGSTDVRRVRDRLHSLEARVVEIIDSFGPDGSLRCCLSHSPTLKTGGMFHISIIFSLNWWKWNKFHRFSLIRRRKFKDDARSN